MEKSLLNDTLSKVIVTKNDSFAASASNVFVEGSVKTAF